MSGQFCRGILIRVSIRKNEMLFSAGIKCSFIKTFGIPRVIGLVAGFPLPRGK